MDGLDEEFIPTNNAINNQAELAVLLNTINCLIKDNGVNFTFYELHLIQG